MKVLETAWAYRETLGSFRAKAPAVRVFYGPTEGHGGELESVAIDRFGDFVWVTLWGARLSDGSLSEVARFLERKGLKGGVVLEREKKGGLPEKSQRFFGDVPSAPVVVEEHGARYEIHLLDTRHPGLFLDHAPLRSWLRANANGWKILNTFAYTGSLSVAAALGGAREVWTSDLSRPSVEWAKENWKLNTLSEERARWWVGDVFDLFPRWAKKGEKFDAIVLDPPSFSRGKDGSRFSTAKDLPRLHEAALTVLAPGGCLISSINSANIAQWEFDRDVESAARAQGVKLERMEHISLPPTFPLKTGEESYLKGGIFRVR